MPAQPSAQEEVLHKAIGVAMNATKVADERASYIVLCESLLVVDDARGASSRHAQGSRCLIHPEQAASFLARGLIRPAHEEAD